MQILDAIDFSPRNIFFHVTIPRLSCDLVWVEKACRESGETLKVFFLSTPQTFYHLWKMKQLCIHTAPHRVWRHSSRLCLIRGHCMEEIKGPLFLLYMLVYSLWLPNGVKAYQKPHQSPESERCIYRVLKRFKRRDLAWSNDWNDAHSKSSYGLSSLPNTSHQDEEGGFMGKCASNGYERSSCMHVCAGLRRVEVRLSRCAGVVNTNSPSEAPVTLADEKRKQPCNSC